MQWKLSALVHLKYFFYISFNLCFSGYVTEMKKLLFSVTKSALDKTYLKYAAKAPEPLTAQFTERSSKEQAVEAYRKRKDCAIQLFPTGTLI